MTPEQLERSKKQFEASFGKRPHPLVVQACSLVSTPEYALDIGCGAMNESRYLLSQGFSVDAIDTTPLITDIQFRPSETTFHPIIGNFNTYIFEAEKYNLAIFINGMSFLSRKNTLDSFSVIHTALKEDGIFAATAFGTDHEWNVADSSRIFFTEMALREILVDFDIISLNEERSIRTAYSGAETVWHSYNILAKKKRRIATLPNGTDE
jgi:SAM-dependent methyltransferase